MPEQVWPALANPPQSAPDTAWNDLLANLDKIGVTLGGETEGSHGVKGSAGLYMLEFKAD